MWNEKLSNTHAMKKACGEIEFSMVANMCRFIVIRSYLYLSNLCMLY